LDPRASVFVQKTSGNCQLINLGAGFDTLFFRLAVDNRVQFKRFIDVDFSSVTAKKLHHILKPNGAELKKIIESKSGRSKTLR
jgi:[phosphatase 2A protein]-leucine-carboxy methyltransferase